jgi:hypothetical protein
LKGHLVPVKSAEFGLLEYILVLFFILCLDD